MKVRWTHTAIGHLASIYEYIARDSAYYAQRMVDRRRFRWVIAGIHGGR